MAGQINRRILIKKVILRFGMFIVFLGLMFFLPAGTFKYWEAWTYLAMLGIPMIIVMCYLINFLKNNINHRYIRRSGNRIFSHYQESKW